MEAVKENGEQGLVPASYIDYDEYEVMQVKLLLCSTFLLSRPIF